MNIVPCGSKIKAFLLMPLIMKNLIYSASVLVTMDLGTKDRASISLECLFWTRQIRRLMKRWIRLKNCVKNIGATF